MNDQTPNGRRQNRVTGTTSDKYTDPQIRSCKRHNGLVHVPSYTNAFAMAPGPSNPPTQCSPHGNPLSISCARLLVIRLRFKSSTNQTTRFLLRARLVQRRAAHLKAGSDATGNAIGSPTVASAPQMKRMPAFSLLGYMRKAAAAASTAAAAVKSIDGAIPLAAPTHALPQ